MKKIILALLISTAVPTAFAGDYEVANAKISMCRATGYMASDSYDDKVGGRAYAQANVDALAGIPIQTLTRFALDYGYYKASSAKDAYMTAWAKCMDNAEWLTRLAQEGKGPPDKLLY